MGDNEKTIRIHVTGPRDDSLEANVVRRVTQQAQAKVRARGTLSRTNWRFHARGPRPYGKTK